MLSPMKRVEPFAVANFNEKRLLVDCLNSPLGISLYGGLWQRDTFEISPLLSFRKELTQHREA